MMDAADGGMHKYLRQGLRLGSTQNTRWASEASRIGPEATEAGSARSHPEVSCLGRDRMQRSGVALFWPTCMQMQRRVAACL